MNFSRASSTLRRSGRRSERGAELIEMALVLPLLVFVLVGIIDFGFLFQQYQAVTNASREGARVAVLPGYQDADIESRVGAYLVASGLPLPVNAGNGRLTIARTSVAPAGGGTNFTVVTVTVRYPHNLTFLSPIAVFFGGDFGAVTLRAASAMRVETAASGT